MSLVILVTAGTRSTFVWAGQPTRNSRTPLNHAVHLRGWRAGRSVFPEPLRALTRGDNEPDIWVSSAEDKAPFGAESGECLYDTGSLFFFAGKRARDADVMMVLWGFPAKLDGKKPIRMRSNGDGDGLLNAVSSAGALDPGNIQWEIVTMERVGDWDQMMRALTLTPAPPEKRPF